MKNLFTVLALLVSASAFAQKVEYACSSSKIDETSTYYLKKYFVYINTTSKTAIFRDQGREVVSEGSVKLKKIDSTNKFLDSSYKGLMWSKDGCSLEVFLTEEMIVGENKGFMMVKQESKCRAPGAWLVCFRL